jgi:hypothetical protein
LIEVVIDKSLLLEREQYWLDKLKPFGKNGFNVCITAGSSLGLKMSDENRKILSERMKGKPVAPNRLKKIRISLHKERH